jgi:hypothetical protein
VGECHGLVEGIVYGAPIGCCVNDEIGTQTGIKCFIFLAVALLNQFIGEKGKVIDAFRASE